MKRIVILGGTGQSGILLAKLLLKHTDAAVTITSRSEEKASTFARSLLTKYGRERVSSARLDASDPTSFIQPLKNAHLLLVASATVPLTRNVCDAAIKANVDYLDIQASPKRIPILKEYEKKCGNLCFITEAGFHPGLPAALIRYAGKKFDNLEGKLTDAHAYGFLKCPIPPSTALDEIVDIFADWKNMSQLFWEGRWRFCSSGRKFDVGLGQGNRSAYPYFTEELRALPTIIPSLRSTGLFMCSNSTYMDYVVLPWLIFRHFVFRDSYKTLGEKYSRASRTFRPPFHCGIAVEAKGLLKNKESHAIRVCMHMSDPYEMTCVPVVAFLKQYLAGTARKPGLCYMGHLVDPVQFVEDMRKMEGVQFIEHARAV
eukprot:TRINITY_DN4212_c0_g1_i1.p1 TRINITY_DN4212_c0_g1~~TRINITY_DN4212_c0_g1_i1.p1  ORF type:complete len:372 (-),score=23.33 TRINITY_DN4212_c0_g1_i1:150-1265(-)